MNARRLASATVLSLCCALGAQQKILEAIGVEKKTTYHGFKFLGDLNRDGYEDIGVHVQLERHYPLTQIGFISGKDGRLLRTLVGNDSYIRTPTPAGDWNADGIPDYVAIRRVTQQSRPPVSEIRSGKDDRLLDVFRPWSVTSTFSIYVANVDLDGDAKPDLVFQNCNPARRQESGLYAISNAKKLLWFISMPWITRGGWTTAAVGDVDSDGCDDIGAFDDWHTANAIYVVSGKTGRVLYKVTGERPSDALGSGEITTCGDIDGDDHDDFAASGQASAIATSVVRVFSGRTGKALFTWRDPEPNSAGFGASIASGYDLDQDGVNDLVVGDLSCGSCKPQGAGGEAHIYSLRTGKKTGVVQPSGVRMYTYFGGRVRMGRPRPGSPFPVFAVRGTYNFSSSYLRAPGRISLYHMLPSGVASFGTTCKGTLPQPPHIGINDKVGPGLRAHLSGAPPRR